ncbi:vWA domain-containing protein [Streptomyces aidingensis]|uniref:Ca-activated chloride channel family protein n=1 Tax=Streptomyces aidingensis TaxID=910347 RepID=A0A1I1FII9_9ACTN|nr:extracellular solute-binding protein [Streptomyces aidingensis]SFB96890.1 Ca-activated chloride channel family protein [Streptomyces aidingensis]
MARSSAGGRRLPLWIGTTVGLAAVLVVFLAVRDGTGDRAGDCVALQVSSSTEKDDLLAELAEEYNDTGRTFPLGTADPGGEDSRDSQAGKDGPDGAGCAEVTVTGTTSGLAMQALAEGWDERRTGAAEPQVWSPISSLWLDLLRERAAAADRGGVLPDAAQEPASITTSVLTIAMPRPMAEALGWPEAEIGWADVLSLSQDPEGWGSLGHPEWGPFALGKDNPHSSTSGLTATVAAFYAATGLSSDLTEENLADPEVREFVAGVESGVLHYSDDATLYMANLYQADTEGRAMGYASAVLVQEQLVHLYNKGAPTGDPAQMTEERRPEVPLVAIHPHDGTLMLDHPFVVLPSASAEQRAAAADFREWLLEPSQQDRFAKVGFRDHRGAVGEDLAETVSVDPAARLSLIEPPFPQVLTAILDAWDDLRKKARVLLVMDVSGSMNEPAGDGRSRLEAAKEAAVASLDLLHEEDEVGLWAFSTETDDFPDTPYREVLPPTPLGEGREAVARAVQGLYAEGGTALYTTVRAAQETMVADFESGRINAVVLLTDGQNEYPADNDLDALLRDVDAGERERTVRIFPIAFSEAADWETLGQIAEASRTRAYDARDPATLDEVMRSVVSNF